MILTTQFSSKLGTGAIAGSKKKPFEIGVPQLQNTLFFPSYFTKKGQKKRGENMGLCSSSTTPSA